MDRNTLSHAIEPTMFYKLQNCVGRGNFGNVYKAINNFTNDIVAIKVIDLENSDDDITTITQEIFFLAKLKDYHITHYITSMLDDSMLWIIMEYCGGGSCSDLIKYCYKNGLIEDKVAFITFNVLHGLIYLHRQKIIHRDIKSANVLLTLDGEIKLGDFGVSGQIQATLKRNTFVGTPYWMAPEVILNHKSNSSHSNGYNEMADIWSLGITVYELVTGAPPLSEYDPIKVMRTLPKRKPPRLQGSQYSLDVKGFIINCLQKDPLERSSALELLNHSFILVNIGNIGNLKDDVMACNERKKAYQAYKGMVKRKRSVSTESEEVTGSYEEICNHDISENVIPTWDFNINDDHFDEPPDYTTCDPRPPETQYSSVVSSNILNERTNSLNNNEITDTPLTGHETNALQKYIPSSPQPQQQEINQDIPEINKAVKYDLGSGMELDPESKSGPRSERLDHPMETDYLNDIIGFCLGEMESRANCEETRVYVNTLLETFNAIEIEVPGFSEVFIEELRLRFQTLDK